MMSARLRSRAILVALGLGVAAWLGACATGPELSPHPRRMPRLELPPQPEGSVRVHIYRPQGLVGMWGRPVILVNGQTLKSTLSDSLLEPNSVVVADVPATKARVTWMQSAQAKENTDPIVLAAPPGSSVYLRWTLEPTFGYLQPVSESQAASEMGPLFFKGYRNFTGVVK